MEHALPSELNPGAASAGEVGVRAEESKSEVRPSGLLVDAASIAHETKTSIQVVPSGSIAPVDRAEASSSSSSANSGVIPGNTLTSQTHDNQAQTPMPVTSSKSVASLTKKRTRAAVPAKQLQIRSVQPIDESKTAKPRPRKRPKQKKQQKVLPRNKSRGRVSKVEQWTKGEVWSMPDPLLPDTSAMPRPLPQQEANQADLAMDVDHHWPGVSLIR
jgi:hypothetical protein